MKNKIIPYKPELKELARKLRKNSTFAEVLLWKKIKSKSLGVEFHRQVPIDNYIVDFFCHELLLAIEIDGSSHEFEEIYEKDVNRQKQLEKRGVSFIRFTDSEVKRDMNNVIRVLECRIDELKDIPLNPPSKWELKNISFQMENRKTIKTSKL